jgi:hypothetical protein
MSNKYLMTHASLRDPAAMMSNQEIILDDPRYILDPSLRDEVVQDYTNFPLARATSDVAKIISNRKYYTKDIREQVILYSIDKDVGFAHPIGSISYKTTNASDVDIYEEIKQESLPKVIDFFKRNLQRIVNQIHTHSDQYFLEVKLGLDHLYSSIPIGDCLGNRFVVDEKFIPLMKAYYQRKLISESEYQIVISLERMSVFKRDQKVYEIVKQMMRKRIVLRWNAKEIKQGYKILINEKGEQYKYTIERGIQEKSQANIEGIFISDDGTYTECSNFFDVRYYQGDQERALNLNQDVVYNIELSRVEDLKRSLYTLMNSQLHPNLMKACKRMFSLGRIMRDINLLQKVYPVVNSQLGKIYQLNSKLKTCIKILNDDEPINQQALYRSLDKVRFQLDELIFIHYDFSDVNHVLEQVLLNGESISKEQLIGALERITSNLLSFINNQTRIKLELLGLYPLPKQYWPKDKPF